MLIMNGASLVAYWSLIGETMFVCICALLRVCACVCVCVGMHACLTHCAQSSHAENLC